MAKIDVLAHVLPERFYAKMREVEAAVLMAPMNNVDEAMRIGREDVATNPDVVVMYATTLADNPNRWVFWEVYANAEAYAAHRDAQHFKDYIAATEDLVEGKEFFVLAADTLVSKESLR